MKFQQKTEEFEILIDFNQNLMIFQTKEIKFHNDSFPNHASKKFETNHDKWRTDNTFEKCFRNFFWRRSRSDFDFLSCGIKFQKKIKKFEIF